jgi:hypothetical protein
VDKSWNKKKRGYGKGTGNGRRSGPTTSLEFYTGPGPARDSAGRSVTESRPARTTYNTTRGGDVMSIAANVRPAEGVLVCHPGLIKHDGPFVAVGPRRGVFLRPCHGYSLTALIR